MYRIYHDAYRRQIIVENSSESYQELSLEAVGDPVNEMITVKIPEVGGIVLGPLPYTYYLKKDGTNPGDYDSTLAYLEGEFQAQGPTPGVRHVYDFVTPATTWQVVHNLGFKPKVTLLSNGKEVIGCVEHVDDDQLTVTFSVPISGSVILV